MPIFVADPVTVYQGEEARQRLQDTNDAEFAGDDGITQVNLERWQQAQEYERDTWLVYNPEATQDRNDEHAAAFDGYAALPDNLGDVLEIGAGPFTNIHHLPIRCVLRSVTLIDPLIEDYQQHPNCGYKDGMYRDIETSLIAKPIEEYKGRKKFDTIILINTIASCYDASAVCNKVHGLLKSGGYLVWGEMPREHDPMDLYDVGHPLALKASFIEGFLSGFEEVYRNGWYFIGRKA